MIDYIFHELLPSPPHQIPSWASWIEVTAHEDSRPLTPLFTLGAVTREIMAYQAHYLSCPGCGVFLINDAGTLKDGINYKNPTSLLVNNLTGNSLGDLKQKIEIGIIPDIEDLDPIHVEQAAVLIGYSWRVYGHWLIDILPKLYLLQKAGFNPLTISYAVPNDLRSWGRDWLTSLGISDRQLIWFDNERERVHARELIIPVPMRQISRASRGFASAADYLIKLLDHNQVSRVTSPSRHIFVSRSKHKNDERLMVNRDEIESIATSNGYEIVYPEEMHILDQVNTFRSASHIVGEYGSGMHSSMFSNAGTFVCCLRSNSTHPSFAQTGLCQVTNQHLGYVFGKASANSINQTFAIDPDDFCLALKLMDTVSYDQAY